MTLKKVREWLYSSRRQDDIDKLEKRVDDLENNLDGLRADTEFDQEEQRKDVDRLSDEVNGMYDAEEDVTTLKRDMALLSDRLANVEREVKGMPARVRADIAHEIRMGRISRL